MTPVKLAIIGTAGRGEDSSRMSHNLYVAMIQKVHQVIDRLEQNGCNVTTLVSGGAAWADHIAVSLFRISTRKSLELHLPCNWNFMKCEYDDTGVRDFRTNPGGTLNFYHRKMPFDSLKEIDEVMPDPTDPSKPKQVLVSYGGGFHQRNTRVSTADAVVALTFGNGRQVKDGGTADTMRKFIARRGNDLAFHVDLNTMLAWPKASA